MVIDWVAVGFWCLDNAGQAAYIKFLEYAVKCCWQNRHRAKSKAKEAWNFAGERAAAAKEQTVKTWNAGWQAHEQANQELFELLTGDPESLEKAWRRHRSCIQTCTDFLKGDVNPFAGAAA